MAYSNVGTPIFYCDNNLFLKSNGTDDSYASNPIANLYPSSYTWEEDTLNEGWYWTYFSTSLKPVNYIAVLGHNLGGKSKIYAATPDGSGISGEQFTINGGDGSVGMSSRVPYNGFTLYSFPAQDTQVTLYIGDPMGGTDYEDEIDANYPNFVAKICSISMGMSYTMPHSPELSLTMSREMDGLEKIRTKGGSDLVNYKYTKPALWNGFPAWEIYHSGASDIIHEKISKLSRSGRRIWDLSFNYLQESDVYPDINMLTNYGISGYSDGDSITDNTLLTDTSFFGNVLHKVGNHTPFIFQPNSNDHNHQNLAICKFDMSKFSFQTKSPNLYSVKIRIREVW